MAAVAEVAPPVSAATVVIATALRLGGRPEMAVVIGARRRRLVRISPSMVGTAALLNVVAGRPRCTSGCTLRGWTVVVVGLRRTGRTGPSHGFSGGGPVPVMVGTVVHHSLHLHDGLGGVSSMFVVRVRVHVGLGLPPSNQVFAWIAREGLPRSGIPHPAISIGQKQCSRHRPCRHTSRSF